MMHQLGGDEWWEKRKRLLQVEKDRKKAFDERAKLKEKKRLRKMQQRKVR